MAVNALCEVDKLYDITSIEAKRYLVGILFPEKMIYSEGVCRTGKLNQAAELIYLENKSYGQKKMRQKSRLKTLPHTGSVVGLFSNNFIADLKKIARI